MGVNIIPREEWGSWEPWSRSPRHPPADTVLWSYTDSDTCSTIVQCRDFMQRIQREHVRLNKLEDIPYNFVVGGDGNVYEARGWLLSPQLVEEAKQYTGTNIYIGIIGHQPNNEDTDEPDSEVLEELIKFGITYELITEDFKKFLIPDFTSQTRNDTMKVSIKYRLEDIGT